MSLAPEARLLRMAEGQYSVFCRSQALKAGVSKAVIQNKLDRGLWLRLHRAVYLPAGVTVEWQQRVMAACLACGPKAAASHGSAAMVWGLADELDVPHVTVPDDCVRGHPGIVVHRARSIEAASHLRFRVTTPRRTLLDLATSLPEDRLERALDNAHRRRLVDLHQFARYLDLPANRARPGSGALRRTIAVRDPQRPIQSDLETIFFNALRRVGLPLPVPQHPVRTRRRLRYIDFAYPDHLLGIELDGYETHGTRRSFEDDRARQNELEALGWRFLRFTWTRLESDPIGVAVDVGEALGLVPSRWRSRSRSGQPFVAKANRRPMSPRRRIVPR